MHVGAQGGHGFHGEDRLGSLCGREGHQAGAGPGIDEGAAVEVGNVGHGRGIPVAPGDLVVGVGLALVHDLVSDLPEEGVLGLDQSAAAERAVPRQRFVEERADGCVTRHEIAVDARVRMDDRRELPRWRSSRQPGDLAGFQQVEVLDGGCEGREELPQSFAKHPPHHRAHAATG